MTHDNSAAVVAKLNTIGATKINDKKQIILQVAADPLAPLCPAMLIGAKHPGPRCAEQERGKPEEVQDD